MAISTFAVSDAVANTGVIRWFIGDPFTVGGMVAIPTEGQATESVPQTLNVFTLPELTGEVPINGIVVQGKPTVTIPVVYTGPETLEMISAHGSASDGYTSPQVPTYTSLVGIPLNEMDTSVNPPTISYSGTTPTWAPAAPENARWYWKVVPRRPDLTSAFENNGKTILNVPFDVFLDTDRPEGHMVVTHGDPVEHGITTIRL